MAKYEPKYRNDAVRTDAVPITIGNKTIPGYLTTFRDGTAKWIRQSEVNLSPNFDYSTLTGEKDPATGKWIWRGTTSNSLPNLASGNNLTLAQVTAAVKSPQLQNPLNGIRVQQLGGIEAAKKIDPTLPLTKGKVSNPNTPPDQTSSVTPGSESQQAIEIIGSIKDKEGGVRLTYPSLSYPLKRKNDQDYIKFTMLRYSPRSLNITEVESDSGSFLGNRKPEQNRQIKGQVTLPIQPNISDGNQVGWGEQPLNAIDAAAAMASLGIIEKGAKGAEEAANKTVEVAGENSGAIKSLTAYSLAEKAIGNQGANLLTRGTGAIINPNLELLFTGPILRGFSFNFTLSAREEKEAQMIKKIIRFFKQGMSVKRSNTNLFLMSPNTFKIQYIYGGSRKDHPWINQIKECALQNFIVNYTPEGNYATYDDGAMTKYDLSLTFSEIDPIYDDDYDETDKNVGGGQDSSIGY